MIQVPTVEWLPAVGMLAVGFIVGILLVGRSRRRPVVAETTQREFADLLARRDALVEQLREPGVADREALELEAARILREIDRRALSVAPSPPRPLTPSTFRGFLWGVGTVAVLALVVFFVTRSTAPRSAAPQAAAAAADGDLAQLEQRVQRAPDDLEARLDLARAYLVHERLMDVFQQTQYVLERQPEHPRALSYQALVRLAMGEADMALEMLQRALGRDPDLLEGRVHLALVYATMGNSAAAAEAVEEAMRRHPQERERLQGLLAQIRSGGSQGRVELLVDAGPGVNVPRGAVLFVVARPEGATEGAPIAVKRVTVSSLPLRVTLGPEDSMMGGQLTERLRIEARIDSDGDPLTRGDADPRAIADGVPLGSTAIRLTLR